MNFFLLNFDFNSYSTQYGILSSVNWNSVAFQVGFWLAVAGVVLQRLLFEISRYPTFTNLATTVLASSMDLTSLSIFVQLTNVLDCTYYASGPALVDGDPNQVCWQGYHLALAFVSLFCFILFYPMAMISSPIWVNRSKE